MGEDRPQIVQSLQIIGENFSTTIVYWFNMISNAFVYYLSGVVLIRLFMTKTKTNWRSEVVLIED